MIWGGLPTPIFGKHPYRDSSWKYLQTSKTFQMELGFSIDFPPIFVWFATVTKSHGATASISSNRRGYGAMPHGWVGVIKNCMQKMYEKLT